MKNPVIKHLVLALIFTSVFMFMLFLGYIVFVGFYMNTGLEPSFIVAAWLFLIVPVLTAYYVAYRRGYARLRKALHDLSLFLSPPYKFNLAFKPKLKIEWVLFVVFTILLTPLVFNMLTSKPRNRFDMVEIDEKTEFGIVPKPAERDANSPQVIFIREIDGKIWHIIKQGNYTNLYVSTSYNYDQVLKSEPIMPIPFSDLSVKDFWYVESDKVLYLLNLRSTNNKLGIEEIVMVKNTSSQEPLQIKNLATYAPGLFAGTKFLNYYPASKELLLVTQGGDACARWGKIWRLGINGERRVTDISDGCNDFHLPSYVGFYNGKLIMTTRTKIDPTSSSFENNIKYTGLYLWDPLTLSKSMISDFTTLDAPVRYVYMSAHDSNFLLVGFPEPIKALHFDLKTNTFLPEDSPAAPKPSTQE